MLTVSVNVVKSARHQLGAIVRSRPRCGYKHSWGTDAREKLRQPMIT